MENTKVTVLKVNKIKADSNQPRQEFDPMEMERLESSIRERGIIVPLTVEKRGGDFVLIDGERRYRCAKKLGIKEARVVVYNSLDEKERLVTRFQLQEQHANWSSYDKARAIEYIKDTTGMTVVGIANLLGMSPRSVNGYLGLVHLSKRTRTIASNYRIPFTYLTEIGHAVKRVDDVKSRRSLEEALVQKVQDKVILTTTEMKNYATAIKRGGNKVVRAIISKKNLTSKQALKEAHADKDIAMNKIYTNVGWVTSIVRKGIEDGIGKAMTKKHEKQLNRLVTHVQRLIKQAGYIPEDRD